MGSSLVSLSFSPNQQFETILRIVWNSFINSNYKILFSQIRQSSTSCRGIFYETHLFLFDRSVLKHGFLCVFRIALCWRWARAWMHFAYMQLNSHNAQFRVERTHLIDSLDFRCGFFTFAFALCQPALDGCVSNENALADTRMLPIRFSTSVCVCFFRFHLFVFDVCMQYAMKWQRWMFDRKKSIWTQMQRR